MSQVINIQSTNASRSNTNRRSQVATVSLWTVQVLLALLFLFAGSTKFIMPGMDLFMQFIGVAEVAGALGLILPGLFRIRRGLTTLAGIGLVIIMVGATVISAQINVVGALFPLVTGLLCAVVVYGRRSWGLI